MAVKIMQTNHVFLAKLGVSPKVLHSLTQKHIVLHLGFKDVKFVAKASGNVIGHVSFPVSVASLMKPDCAQSTKQVVLGQVNKVLEAVLANGAMPVEGEPGPMLVTPEDIQHKVKVKQPEPTPAATAGNKPALPVAEVLKMAPVPLKDATRLYQPVHGTSQGSVYYVVALGPDAALAARITGHNVSIRAERVTPKGEKALLPMKIEKKGAYMSAHLKAVKSSPTRVVGAVLLGSGLEWVTPTPNLTVLP